MLQRARASVTVPLALILLPVLFAWCTAETTRADGAGRDQEPVYRVPLRVHLGESARSVEAFRPILEEINDIWLSQAGICFEMEAIITGPPAQDGIDLWFLPALEEGEELNGAFRNDHDIRVRDTPNLAPARRPARHPAARTAAHELGHSLGLPHRQDADDNLMRSKTYGWQLNEAEIGLARGTAKDRALQDRGPSRCRIIAPEQH
jgi:hypothetical protein